MYKSYLTFKMMKVQQKISSMFRSEEGAKASAASDHALVVGNPARQTWRMCECGEKLNEDLQCPICSKKYNQVRTTLLLTPNR